MAGTIHTRLCIPAPRTARIGVEYSVIWERLRVEHGCHHIRETGDLQNRTHRNFIVEWSGVTVVITAVKFTVTGSL
jgi:hypothetical protein